MRITHTWTDEVAVICIDGLKDRIRMVHVTDAHIALIDERDAEHLEACRRSCETFRTIRRGEDGQPVPADATFTAMMEEIRRLHPDIVALTGDILHFPSQANLEHAIRTMEPLEAPVLYTAGNHDWHFPGVEGRGELREACWPLLEPLHHGQPAYGRHEIDGLQFLYVDNSTYQLTWEQQRYVARNLANALPTVLLMHIPLSIATLRTPTIERWKAPILIADPDWPLESRNRWGAGEDEDATIEFVRTLVAAENLAAVFCGHIHFPHADTVNPWTIQYVGAPAFTGAKRVVEFCPLIR